MTQIAPSVTQSEPTTGVADRPPRRRDAHLDNAKFLGVLLVVCGHVLADLKDAPGGRTLYLLIYTFHMPLFIVLAGYFSRGFSRSGSKARKLITSLAVPYVIFEVAFALFRWLIGLSAKPTISLLDPYFVTWFLIALLAWRLSTPVWQQLRWPIGVAVAISLLAGTSDLPSELDLHRMLGLLPFFVAGLMLKPEHLALLKVTRVRILGAATLLCGLGAVIVIGPHVTAEWVLWRISYADIGVSEPVGIAMRSGMLLGGAVMVAAFLAVVPIRHLWFTRLGSATMFAFLLHGFGLKVVEAQGWYDPAWLHTWYGLIVAMVAALGFGVLLMTAPVRRVTGWAVAPTFEWAFRSGEPTSERSGRPRNEVFREASEKGSATISGGRR